MFFIELKISDLYMFQPSYKIELSFIDFASLLCLILNTFYDYS